MEKSTPINRILKSIPSQMTQQQNSQKQMAQQVPQVVIEQNSFQNPHFHCRNVYEHIEECPICNKYYKQSNRFYIFIIIVLVLFIIFLLRRD